MFFYKLTLLCIASANTNDVELLDFKTNKWESKDEWRYPFDSKKG